MITLGSRHTPEKAALPLLERGLFAVAASGRASILNQTVLNKPLRRLDEKRSFADLAKGIDAPRKLADRGDREFAKRIQ